MNEIIENVHYATVYIFYSIYAVCLAKYLTVMTLTNGESAHRSRIGAF